MKPYYSAKQQIASQALASRHKACSLSNAILGAATFTALACIIPPPSAQAALTFTTTPEESNPFFFNSETNTNWTLTGTGSSVTAITDGVKFASGDGLTLIETWTSSSSATPNQPYLIRFNYFFDFDEVVDPAEAFYCLDDCITQTELTASGLVLVPVQAQRITFSIQNQINGGGDLTITNFNATPVPSPLPIAGLGLAALGIYRARRRKSSHT